MKVKVTDLEGGTFARISRGKPRIDTDFPGWGPVVLVAFGDHQTPRGIDERVAQDVNAGDCRHLSRYFAKLARKLDKVSEPVLTEY